jgi:hypothetical protein
LKEENQLQEAHNEDKIELSFNKRKSYTLLYGKKHIFLAGAAGPGKIVTLKEILRRVRKRKK